MKFKGALLDFAEVLDAYRLVPRFLVGLYALLVYNLYIWFKSIKTIEQTSCDAAVLNSLLDRGIDLAAAQEVACTVVEVLGGPTTGHTIMVTAVTGLSSAIFAFYVNSGRIWERIDNFRRRRVTKKDFEEDSKIVEDHENMPPRG